MTSRSLTARGVESYYADLHADRHAVRVCQGLSCQLAGSPELQARVGRERSCRSVYCLGYCDRSPALLTPDGEAVVGPRAQAWPHSAAGGAASDLRSDVRCVSRAPVVTARIARGDHSALTAAQRAGVYEALAQALAGVPATVLQALEESGEQGRGGAGFPTGRKWRMCAQAAGTPKYVVANGDEGDPGSFIDRVLLESDPHAVLEGLALCAFAVGASEGIIYIRSEYPLAQLRMQQAIVEAHAAGLLGGSVLGFPFAFDVRLVGGHGSYVCGEETALLNAIEGRRGEVRVRPPYPVECGLSGQPTVVNNIETLVNIPWILRHGAGAYRTLGTATSPGTKVFCLNHGFARPGIVEAEFGLTLRELIEHHGGGARSGERLSAVALGGPMGSVLTPERWDISLDYATLARQHIRLGHAGLVAIPESADPAALLAHWLQFMAEESCGKCVPCREGSRRALEMARRLPGLALGEASRLAGDLMTLLSAVEATSLCGFGQGIPAPARTLAALSLARIGERSRGT
jgi:NADH:ubiquinone oxidoreductase subunit F (NADH-binding)